MSKTLHEKVMSMFFFILFNQNGAKQLTEATSSHESSVSVNISPYPSATSSHVYIVCQTAKELSAVNKSLKLVKTWCLGLQEHRTISTQSSHEALPCHTRC